MKKILLIILLSAIAGTIYSQTTYYWVGGASAPINTLTNWNTALNGSGSARTSNTNATDILIFDGSNLGGATPYTGAVTASSTASISCGQLKFTNNAVVNMTRSSSGTTTITIAGGSGDDFVIDAGSSLFVPSSTAGSLRYAMAATNTGRVSGVLSFISTQQVRIDNTTTGTPASLIFTTGSSFTTNITSASSSYAFGNSTQSSEKWVVFESGSQLYYEGGFSPHGSGNLFSAIDMKPGSTWHHRASNPIANSGNFFNRKTFGNVSVENAVLTALGPIYSMDNVTVTNGSSFITNSSGQTAVLGNLVVDGSFTSPAAATNTLVIGGSTSQTISGNGTINVGSLVIGDHADVSLNMNLAVMNGAIVYGKINFNNYQLSGSGNFLARSGFTNPNGTGNVVLGNYFITGVTAFASSAIGTTVTGTGIAPNSTVISYSSALDTVYISKPVVATATGAALSYSTQTATLATSNANGFNPSTGSVVVSGTKDYLGGISYIINGSTASPFGISSAPNNLHADVKDAIFNAAAVTNTTAYISGTLQLNAGKLTVRAGDTLRILPGGTISGTINSSNYIVTDANTSTGAQGILRIDNVTGATLFPIGSANYYLPAIITAASASDLAVATFQGITENAIPNGTPLTAAQKQTRVDAVWNINRVSGSGGGTIQLSWDQLLEGTTFSGFANSDIGIVVNTPPNWSLPLSTGDNTLNIANATVTGFGNYSIGAQPPAQAFIFNPFAPKTYGDPDFNGGAFSLNTSQPVIYSSSNPAVATIVSNNVHITGVGQTVITATQASDGFYPAQNQNQTLTVNKANLTITADNKAKPEGDPNPPLTISYSGFVYGETNAVLTTQPTITTSATTSSPAGNYPITVCCAVAANYNISYVNGVMTVTPRSTQTITFNALPTKTYGNADFAAGATSTNNTIPIVYSSSNTSVATIAGSNIHIVGAGTTTITASQAGNALYFPATPVSRTLTVNKANLTVRAADTARDFNEPNPTFRLVYSGFVLGQSPSVLTTQPVPTTAATQTSPPGYYSIDVGGGSSNNYNFIYTSGRLTVYPPTGTSDTYIRVYQSAPGKITVKIYSPSPDLADIFIYDEWGRPIARKNVFIAQGFITADFNVPLLASGRYIVYVNGKTYKLTKSFVFIH